MVHADPLSAEFRRGDTRRSSAGDLGSVASAHMRRLQAVVLVVVTVAFAMGGAGWAQARPAPPREFDLQAHRGGIGLTTESTLDAFDTALRLGVTTLELDTQVTRDLRVVVSHDRQISGEKCADTAAATPGDPRYPYVGK